MAGKQTQAVISACSVGKMIGVLWEEMCGSLGAHKKEAECDSKLMRAITLVWYVVCDTFLYLQWEMPSPSLV